MSKLNRKTDHRKFLRYISYCVSMCYVLVHLEPPIGFSAYATADVDYASSGAIVIFDDVVSNFGGYYDNASSIFWCPVNGVYLVFVNIMGTATATANVEIMVDDVPVGRARADMDAANQNKGSGFVLVDCSVGQNVWIMNNYNSQVVFAGTRQSTFSVYLLHAYT